MATDRIIYQSESLFVSKIDGTGSVTVSGSSDKDIDVDDISEINRVQDMSYNMEVTRTDINEFGQLAALSREVTEPPTVTLDFSYYLTNGTQESNLGFNLNSGDTFPDNTPTSFTKNLLDGTGSVDELNYYIVTSPEGEDVHGQGVSPDTTAINAADHGCIGIGNGFITSYGITAAVGELATASVSVEASNILFKNGLASGMNNPAIDIDSTVGAKIASKVDWASVSSSDGDHKDNRGGEIFAIRPGDITVDFDASGYIGSTQAGALQTGGAVLPGAGASAPTTKSAIHLQNVSIDLPVGRSPLTRLGNHYPFARKVDFPVNMTLSASALMTDIDDGSLDALICGGETPRDIAITLNTRCGDTTAMVFVMRNAILDTQAFSASIGDNKTVDLTFSSQIGGANDSTNGVFCFAKPLNSAGAYGAGTATAAITPTP
mgnify:CR=1 FL=1